MSRSISATARREQNCGQAVTIYRTAVRTGLNELRRETRRSRYESLFGFFTGGQSRKSPTPEEIHAAKEEREKVRLVLSIIQPRQAELLLLRIHGFWIAAGAAAIAGRILAGHGALIAGEEEKLILLDRPS